MTDREKLFSKCKNSIISDLQELKRYGFEFAQELIKLLISMRIPLFVLALFLITPKLIPIWLLIIFSVLALQAVFRYFPTSWQQRFTAIATNPHVSGVWRELKEGAGYMKPFLYAAVFLTAAPLSVLIMIGHWIRKLFGAKTESTSGLTGNADSLMLRQNIPQQKNSDQSNFFQSPAFAATILVVFCLGIPAAIAMSLYQQLDIGNLLGAPSFNINHSPMDFRNFETGTVLGHGPRLELNKHLSIVSWPRIAAAASEWHLALYMYLMSLAWCVTTLFFRAYFTFPLNFASTEYDIEVNEKGVQKHPIKGWFAEVLWYCWPEYLPRVMPWTEIEHVQYIQGGVGRLNPLPDNLFSKQSLVYQVLNQIAAYTDATIDKLGRTDYVNFVSGGFANGIKVHLWELSTEERVRLFYAIRKWAPSIYLDQTLQQKLLGSTVMREPKYTEIWFDLLVSQRERKRQVSLQPGDTLRDGMYTIVKKIGAGGQAVVFLANTSTNELVVLKEFVLSGGEAIGALVESGCDFENESSVLSRLSHPGIVEMRGIFAEDQRAYVVLEYIDGSSLRQKVTDGGALSEGLVIELALKLCDVLQYLHSMVPPVVHRDFTPENIIFQRNGQLKLIDFSVASRTGPHKSGDCVGKHSYTPPEQFRSAACPQSDIYALGATLYFLLTGSDPRPISKSNPRQKGLEVSEEIASIIERATELDLNKRYDSVHWLKLDLETLRDATAHSSDVTAHTLAPLPAPAAAARAMLRQPTHSIHVDVTVDRADRRYTSWPYSTADSSLVSLKIDKKQHTRILRR